MDDKFIFAGAVIVAVMFFGLFVLLWHGGNLDAQREQKQVMACLEQGGVWMDDFDLCVWSKGELQ